MVRMKNEDELERQPVPTPAAGAGKDHGVRLAMAVLILVVIAVVMVRLKAAPVPLERDEGEYALMGQLILEGVAPYREAGNMKLPGTYYAYAAILALFGQTISGIHVGLMVVNLLTAGILFLIASRLLGRVGATLAVAAFLIMSVDLSVLGLFAHATHFVIMFALAGVWLLQESSGSKREVLLLWGAGLCLGLAVLMKQSGALFALFGCLWVLFDGRRTGSWKRSLVRSGILACGIVLPYAAFLVVTVVRGTFDRFWFWTVDYAQSYVSLVGYGLGLELFRVGIVPIIRSNPVIWAMAPVGMIGLCVAKGSRRTGLFLITFFLFSFLAVCPGLYFRQHYFVQILPAAALGAGAALRIPRGLFARVTMRPKTAEAVVFLGIAAFSLPGILSMWHGLSTLTPEQFSRSVYGSNPFPESVAVAEYIAKNTGAEERIAVLGSEPQIYFYAHRRPATEHIYMYGLMEPQPFALRMQEALAAQVEKSEPQFIVLVLVSTSWLQRGVSEKKVFGWMRGYLNTYYQAVMTAEIQSDRTVWSVDEDVRTSQGRRGSSRLIVYRRKPAGSSHNRDGGAALVRCPAGWGSDSCRGAFEITQHLPGGR